MSETHAADVVAIGDVVSEIAGNLPSEMLQAADNHSAAAQELLASTRPEAAAPVLSARESLHRAIASLEAAGREHLPQYVASLGLGNAGGADAEPMPDTAFSADNPTESQAALDRRVERVRERFRNGEQVLSLLVERLIDSIKEGRWSSLLIEGRSAWLPGQVVGGIMRRYAEEHNLPTPSLLAMSGNRRPEYAKEGTEEAQALQDHAEQLKSEAGERTLVFTEYIQTGWSLAGVARALQRAGVAFDVAAIEADGLEDDYRENLTDYLPPDTQVLIGNDNLLGGHTLQLPAFYDGREPDLQLASGLQREGTQLVKTKDMPDAIVQAAHEEAKALEEKLYKKYFSGRTP